MSERAEALQMQPHWVEHAWGAKSCNNLHNDREVNELPLCSVDATCLTRARASHLHETEDRASDRL